MNEMKNAKQNINISMDKIEERIGGVEIRKKRERMEKSEHYVIYGKP